MTIPIMLLEHSPRTAMLLGAALSGGDVMAMARAMAECEGAGQ